MLQRLQTVWLLLAAVLAFVSLKVSFFSGNILVENAKQFQNFTAMSNMLIMILTVGVGIASLITIFLFKDRKLQIKISFAVLAVAVLTIGLYYLQTKNYVPEEWTFDLTSLVTVAIPFLLFLAIRGIYKDEKLVKSVDRLR
jgi:glucose uptake protein GlcU